MVIEGANQHLERKDIRRAPVEDFGKPCEGFLVALRTLQGLRLVASCNVPLAGKLLVGEDLQGLPEGHAGLRKKLWCGFTCGPRGLFHEGEAEVVLGDGPVLGELLACVDEEHLSVGSNRFCEKLGTALPLGPSALQGERIAEAVLDHCPALWKLLARVDAESLSMGFDRFCEQLSAALPLGPLSLRLKCNSQVMLSGGPALWKLLARVDAESLSMGFDRFCEQLSAVLPLGPRTRACVWAATASASSCALRCPSVRVPCSRNALHRPFWVKAQPSGNCSRV